MMQIRPNMIGYHVNDEERCLKFIKEDQYIINSPDEAWLGYGMYFWDNESNANYWITQKRRKDDNMNKIAKVKGNIFTDKMLDLTDTDQIKAFNKLWNLYCKKEKCSKAQPLGIKLDRLFDYFKLDEDFKVIRVYGRYTKTPNIAFIPYDSKSERCEPIYNVKCIYLVKDSKYIVNRELMEVI